MPDTPMEDRRFTDAEVQQILKKAVEHTPSRALARAEGLSLADLKSIGAEVGIDPVRLEEAARAVVSAGSESGWPARVLGAPLSVHLERQVPGTLAAEDSPDVLSLIRRTMGRQGEARAIHGALEWSVSGDIGQRHLSLSTRDGTTSIRGTANLTNAALVTYLPAGIMGAFASVASLVGFANTGNPVALAAAVGIPALLYPILRTVLRKVTRSETAKLERTVDELARLASAPDRPSD